MCRLPLPSSVFVLDGEGLIIYTVAADSIDIRIFALVAFAGVQTSANIFKC